MTSPTVYISPNELTGKTEHPALLTDINQLAVSTGLPIATEVQIRSADFYLYRKDKILTLKDQSTNNTVDICVNFCSGKNKHRLQFGGGFGQPLARAINAKNKVTQTVCDATGGLGHDAFVFASLGCEVIIFERSPVVFALLEDAIKRAQDDSYVQQIVQRMEVHQLDSRQLGTHWPCNTPPATVYLDPMYPHSTKTAAAKKGMQSLQRLLPNTRPAINQVAANTSDEHELLNAALATATHRVVVKRPAKAPPLADSTPVGCIKSPNTRYDIYNPGN